MADTTDAPTAPDSLPKYLVDGLPKQDTATLEDARNYIEALLEYRRQPVAADGLPDDAEPVDEDSEGTLVKERVKCGADCTCNNGNGHGPYLYSYKRVDGKLVSKYVGKA